MPDHTISTEQLTMLAPALTAIQTLAPKNAKCRYAIAKLTDATDVAFARFGKIVQQLATECAVPDSMRDTGNGRVTFQIADQHRERYLRESAALLTEEVVLSGVRPITHAELGECPLTIEQEKVLIQCKLLDDVEPS